MYHKTKSSRRNSLFYEDLFNNYFSVFGYGDGHTGLDMLEKFLAQTVNDRHLYIFQPYICQNNAGACQRVDGLGKEHTSRLSAHGTTAVDDQTAGGGANGLR